MSATKSILIVDDEPNLRKSLMLILQRGGYSITGAGSAQEALQLLKAGAFDLVFLDIKLPDRNGTAILPEIRQMYPDMPVILLTAHATLDTAIDAVRAGARDYLIKPIDPEHILVRTREVLAEMDQPARRREITSQIQSLLTELNLLESDNVTPAPILPTLPPTDPARYLRCGKLTVDLHTRHVLMENRLIPLPPSTFDYLITLVRHAPEPVPYQTLVRESQGYELTRIEACEITRWQIHELRKALEEDPRKPKLVFTVRDVGYRLVA